MVADTDIPVSVIVDTLLVTDNTKSNEIVFVDETKITDEATSTTSDASATVTNDKKDEENSIVKLETVELTVEPEKVDVDAYTEPEAATPVAIKRVEEGNSTSSPSSLRKVQEDECIPHDLSDEAIAKLATTILPDSLAADIKPTRDVRQIVKEVKRLSSGKNSMSESEKCTKARRKIEEIRSLKNKLEKEQKGCVKKNEILVRQKSVYEEMVKKEREQKSIMDNLYRSLNDQYRGFCNSHQQQCAESKQKRNEFAQDAQQMLDLLREEMATRTELKQQWTLENQALTNEFHTLSDHFEKVRERNSKEFVDKIIQELTNDLTSASEALKTASINEVTRHEKLKKMSEISVLLDLRLEEVKKQSIHHKETFAKARNTLKKYNTEIQNIKKDINSKRTEVQSMKKVIASVDLYALIDEVEELEKVCKIEKPTIQHPWFGIESNENENIGEDEAEEISEIVVENEEKDKSQDKSLTEEKSSDEANKTVQIGPDLSKMTRGQRQKYEDEKIPTPSDEPFVNSKSKTSSNKNNSEPNASGNVSSEDKSLSNSLNDDHASNRHVSDAEMLAWIENEKFESKKISDQPQGREAVPVSGDGTAATEKSEKKKRKRKKKKKPGVKEDLDQENDTENMQPTTENMQPDTENMQPTTKNMQPTTENMQPDTGNMQPDTENMQPTVDKLCSESVNGPESEIHPTGEKIESDSVSNQTHSTKDTVDSVSQNVVSE